MPVIHTYTSAHIEPETRERLKATWGKAIENVPGKNEHWLMCIFEDDLAMYHGGTDDEPCAYVTVGVYAPTPVDKSAWEALTPIICGELERELGVNPRRVYISYSEGKNFGWNNMNF